MPRLIGLIATVSFVGILAGCGSAEHAWPEPPSRLEPVDATVAETAVDVLTIGSRAAAGSEFEVEETLLLDLGDVPRSDVIESYQEQLEPEWEDQEVLLGASGRVWERDDQRFTLMLVDIGDTRLLVSIESRRT